jgi:hypothetical protein
MQIKEVSSIAIEGTENEPEKILVPLDEHVEVEAVLSLGNSLLEYNSSWKEFRGGSVTTAARKARITIRNKNWF